MAPTPASGEKSAASAMPHSSSKEPAKEPVKEPKTNVGEGKLIELDQDILKAVKDILERCTIEDETGWVRGCPKKKQLAEVEALRSIFKSKGLLTVLPTMAHLLEKGDDRQRNLVTAELDTSFARKFPAPYFLHEVRKGGASIDKVTAGRLVKGLYGLNETSAGHLVGTATHAATMTDQVDLLLRAVRDMPYRDLTQAAYRNLLAIKRLTYFKLVVAFAKSGDLRSLLTAVQAVAAVDEPTDDERAEMCPWAATYLHHRDSKIASEVARVLIRCGGSFREKVVQQVGERLDAGAFLLPKELIGAVGNMCQPPVADERESLCLKAYELLKRTVSDLNTEWAVRAYAIETLALRWPNKATLVFLRKHENSSIPHIKWAAKGAIFSLSSVGNIRDGASVDTSKPMRLPSWALTGQDYGIGQTVELLCPPNGHVGLVVGSGPYSSASSICSSAVHAGKVSRAEGGKIRFRIVKRERSYKASPSNGIKSLATGPESKTSFVFR